MEISGILSYISKANKEETKMILDAAISRREKQMDGGEVHYAEFSRQMVERRNVLMKQMIEYEERIGERDIWEEGN